MAANTAWAIWRREGAGDTSADDTITGVFFSNSANVFLGVGCPWLMAAIYHKTQGTVFQTSDPTLSFNSTLYASSSLAGYSLRVAKWPSLDSASSAVPAGSSGSRECFLYSSGFLMQS